MKNYNNVFLSKVGLYLSSQKLLVLSIPYLILSFKGDHYFSFIEASLISFFFLLIDFFLDKIDMKLFYYVSAIITSYFLYSLIIYNDTYYVIHLLRFRSFSVIFILVMCLIFFFQTFKSQDSSFLNTILIVFSLIQIFNFKTDIPPHEIFKNYNFQTDIIDLKSPVNNQEPLIFIIVDGLTTSSEIYSVTNDTLDLEFEKYLISNKYKVLNKFKSESAWTQFSLTSLFNFNLHKSDTLKKLELLETNNVFEKDFRTLIHQNLLVDSLNKYGVNSYSYGSWPFMKAKKSENVLYLWKKIQFNFDIEFLKEYKILKSIFHKSVLNFIDSRFLNGKNFVFDTYRKITLDNLETLNFKSNTFYYFHFLAPHDPYSYFDEFPYLEKNNNDFMTHVNYRRFMMRKLTKTLSLDKFNNVKIILSGDHGLRSNYTNDKLTMAAFRGFEEEIISKLRSVQDLGSLIFYSFKN